MAHIEVTTEAVISSRRFSTDDGVIHNVKYSHGR